MPEKMEGVIAQLKTFDEKGRQVDSEYVFRPFCDWWIGKLHDYLAQTRYEHIGTIIDEFGIDVAERILEGEVVPVTRELSDEEILEKGLEKVTCVEAYTIEKTRSTIRYPYRGGTKEYLSRRGV